MKYRLVSFFSILLSIIFSLFFTVSSTGGIQGIQAFSFISRFLLQGMTFLTVSLILSSLCIAVNQLLRARMFWDVIRYFFSSTVIVYFIFQVLTFFVIKIPFLPSDQVPDISLIHSSLSIFGLDAQAWENMQDSQGLFSWLLIFSQLNPSHYLVWVLLFCALGFAMLHDIEIAEPAYNLADSLSRLLFYLLEKLFALLSIYLIVHIIYTFRSIHSNTLLPFYLTFLLRLTIIVVLLFVIVPGFLLFFYKDKNAYRFFWQSFLSTFTSFLTGNAMFSMGVLIVEQKCHLKSLRTTTGLLNPLNMLFLRPGSAIVLACSFMSYYSSITRWELNFFSELLWLILVPIGFAVIIGLFSIPNYFMVLPFYFVLFGLGTTDTFVIMTPILLLGQSFANCIDLLSWNLSNYIHEQFYVDRIKDTI